MWRKFCFLVGLEICDECQHWTTGEHCEFCKQGSYGDATAKQGIQADVIFFVSMTRDHKYVVYLTDFHSLRY